MDKAKLTAYLTLVAMAIVTFLFIFMKVDMLVFWLTMGIAFIIAYKVVPRMRK